YPAKRKSTSSQYLGMSFGAPTIVCQWSNLRNVERPTSPQWFLAAELSMLDDAAQIVRTEGCESRGVRTRHFPRSMPVLGISLFVLMCIGAGDRLVTVRWAVTNPRE